MSYTCCLLLTILVILPSWFGKYIYARIKCFSCWFLIFWFLIKSYFFISFSSSGFKFWRQFNNPKSLHWRQTSKSFIFMLLFFVAFFSKKMFYSKCSFLFSLFFPLTFHHKILKKTSQTFSLPVSQLLGSVSGISFTK